MWVFLFSSFQYYSARKSKTWQKILRSKLSAHSRRNVVLADKSFMFYAFLNVYVACSEDATVSKCTRCSSGGITNCLAGTCKPGYHSFAAGKGCQGSIRCLHCKLDDFLISFVMWSLLVVVKSTNMIVISVPVNSG